jgi:hypothetical protein
LTGDLPENGASKLLLNVGQYNQTARRNVPEDDFVLLFAVDKRNRK